MCVCVTTKEKGRDDCGLVKVKEMVREKVEK